MSEQSIPEIPVLPDPEKVGIIDRLRQIPATAREHAGRLTMAAVAGLSLGVPSLLAHESNPIPTPKDGVEQPTTLGTETVQQKRVTGYWMLAGHGLVQPFGDAKYYGSGPSDSIAIAATPTGKGYWILESNNAALLPYGDAKLGGSGHEMDWRKNEKAVGMAAMSEGEGAWVVTSTGRVFAEGNATHFGDASNLKLNQPMRGIIPTPSGKGYWLQAADGGVFSYGDAKFYGSTGSMRLNQPIIGLIPDPDGRGYWLVGADGGIFSFDADFYGSTGSMSLNEPVVKGLPGTEGYAEISRDGGIFNFGKLPYYGSAANNPHMKPVVDATLKFSDS
jgi:hypothetical protein